MVLEIHFQTGQGLFELTSEYTAYPEESEVLIQDGLEYLIHEINEEINESNGKPFKVITLKYPTK